MSERNQWERDTVVWLAGRRIESAGRRRAAAAIRASMAWRAAAEREAAAARFAERVRTRVASAGRGVRLSTGCPSPCTPKPRWRPHLGPRPWSSSAWPRARAASCSRSRARRGSPCRPAFRPAGTWRCGWWGTACATAAFRRCRAGRSGWHGRDRRRGGGPAPGPRLRGEAGGAGPRVGAFARVSQPGVPDAGSGRRGPGRSSGRWCFGGAATVRRNRDLPPLRSQGIIRPRAEPARAPPDSECPWYAVSWIAGGSRSCSSRSFQPAPAAGPLHRAPAPAPARPGTAAPPAARHDGSRARGLRAGRESRAPAPEPASRAPNTGSSGPTTSSRRSSIRSPSGSPGRARSPISTARPTPSAPSTSSCCRTSSPPAPATTRTCRGRSRGSS